ncbi:MAG: SDR family oxidoreductase [Lentisphaerota bacterium]
MNSDNIPIFRDLAGKVAIVTGAGGIICGVLAEALAAQKVKVAIWDISMQAAEKKAGEIMKAGGVAIAVKCNVLDKKNIEEATAKTLEEFGTADILINGAGGSRKDATTSPELSFFDIAPDSLMNTLALNYQSTVLPSQAVGRIFAEKGKGVILNIASIAGIRPLTRAVAYSNGKSAVINFTQWLAVHMAKEYSPLIRVNALAPGFVLTEQNRFLLMDEKTGQPTERGMQVMKSVPMGRYGEASEMSGAALWLVSESSSFVTGIVVPVDGGLTASAGV